MLYIAKIFYIKTVGIEKKVSKINNNKLGLSKLKEYNLNILLEVINFKLLSLAVISKVLTFRCKSKIMKQNCCISKLATKKSFIQKYSSYNLATILSLSHIFNLHKNI